VLHIHGGGFVYHPAQVGNVEAVLMARISGFEVASVSYRMPWTPSAYVRGPASGARRDLPGRSPRISM
jgi:hypothetical protein